MKDEQLEQIVELAEEEVEALEEEEVVEEEVLTTDQIIEDLNNQIAGLNDQLLRTVADSQNFKRRITLDAQQEVFRAKSAIFLELLEVVDNFERALEVESSPGLEIVYNNFIKILNDNGVKKIESLHQEFDANLHQAVMMESNSEFAANIITAEMACGYTIDEKILRPAMVKVNQ